MKRAPWLRACLVLGVFRTALAAQTVTDQPAAPDLIDPGFAVAVYQLVDVNGDGRADLVVISEDGRVATWTFDAGGRVLAPSAQPTLTLPEPARTLVAFGRLDRRVAGVDLVTLSPLGTTLYRAGSDGAFGTTGAEVSHRARFNLRTGKPLSARMLADLNNDGLLDLVVPSAASCEIWLNKEGAPESAPTSAPAIPRLERAASVALDTDRTVRTRAAALSDVLESSFEIPALSTSDLNGDGRLDLLVEDGSVRNFHLQRADGTLPEHPSVSVDLSRFRDTSPKSSLRPGRTLAGGDDARFNLRDLDADGIPDCVIAHRRKVWVFHGGANGPQFAEPSDILKSDDEITALLVLKLDDDALRDLLLVKVQVPTIGALIGGLFGEWDVDVSVAGYRNGGARRFETTPKWRRDLTIRLPSLAGILRDPAALLSRFEEASKRFRLGVEADFDGDGSSDVALLTEAKDRIEVWTGRSPLAGHADSDEAILRRILFEEKDAVWDIDRILAAIGGLAEARFLEKTGGRPPDRSIPAPPGGKVLALEAADLDGDRKAEVLAVSSPAWPDNRLRFTVLRPR